MEDDALFTAQSTDGVQILNHTDFIVHSHHAGEDGVRANCRLEHFQIQQTVFIDVQIRDFKALTLQLTHGVQHSLVLGLHRDQVLALALVEVRSTLDRQVVGLGRTAGPHDFAGVSIDQLGHLLAGILDSFFSFPAPGMTTRGSITKMLTQPRNHRVYHAGVHGSRCAVIEINGKVRGHVHDWLVLFLADKS